MLKTSNKSNTIISFIKLFKKETRKLFKDRTVIF